MRTRGIKDAEHTQNRNKKEEVEGEEWDEEEDEDKEEEELEKERRVEAVQAVIHSLILLRRREV